MNYKRSFPTREKGQSLLAWRSLLYSSDNLVWRNLLYDWNTRRLIAKGTLKRVYRSAKDAPNPRRFERTADAAASLASALDDESMDDIAAVVLAELARIEYVPRRQKLRSLLINTPRSGKLKFDYSSSPEFRECWVVAAVEASLIVYCPGRIQR